MEGTVRKNGLLNIVCMGGVQTTFKNCSPLLCNVFFVIQIKYLRMKMTSLVSKSMGRGNQAIFPSQMGWL